jgi:hypothetical protein
MEFRYKKPKKETTARWRSLFTETIPFKVF